MADVDFDEFDNGYAPPVAGRMGRVVHLAGAACSVALVVGMAIWGYKLAIRDVSGIPVVRALPDPMRMAPVTPGGVETMHQGLSVNAVAAAGTVSPLPEMLILAPQEIDLAADDLPGLTASDQLPAGDAVVAQTVSASVAAEIVPMSQVAAADAAPLLSAEETALAVTGAEEDAVAAALASALTADSAPIAGDAVAGGLGDAIASTPRPPARPAKFASADVGGETTARTAAAKEVDFTTIAVGTRLVQLGAFDDEATARSEWVKLEAQFPDLISTKSMVVQPAQSGGRTFYRLRALGFDDEDAARKFCTVLLEQNVSCIPATQK